MQPRVHGSQLPPLSSPNSGRAVAQTAPSCGTASSRPREGIRPLGRCTGNPLFRMAAASAGRRPRVLLGVTGSVAAVKAPQLALKFASAGCDVRVVLTAKGAHFWKLTETYNPPSWASVAAVPGATEDRPISPVAARALATSCSAPEALGDGFPATGVQAVLRDADEWDAYSTVKEDPVLHIEVSRRRCSLRPACPSATRTALQAECSIPRLPCL